MRLWELAGADPSRVFSPYVWRVRLTLAHKAVSYDSKVWRYSDKEPAQQVLKDDSFRSPNLLQQQ